MTRVEVEPGVRVFAREDGRGDPVVALVAGFGLDHRVWDHQAQALAHSHRVIRVDQRGHGISDKPAHGYDIARLSGDLAAVLEAMDASGVTVVGWSFGGQVAFHLASERPDLVARLVLVGSNGVRASRSAGFPFGRPPEMLEPALVRAEQEDRAAARRDTIVSGFAGPPDRDLVDRLVDTSLHMPSAVALACYHSMLTTDLVDRIPAVTMPVLQLVGRHDPVHSARGAHWLAAQLGDSRLVEIDDCGHYPMFEAPATFGAELAAFCRP